MNWTKIKKRAVDHESAALNSLSIYFDAHRFIRQNNLRKYLLVSGIDFPPNNMKELIAYAKARPGELNYSSPLGGYSHLDMLDFTKKAGLKLVNIPSKGAGSSQVGLVAGDIHFTILNAASSLTLIKAKKLKAFAA